MRKHGRSGVVKIRRNREQAYTSNWSTISAYIKKRDNYTCRDCNTYFGISKSYLLDVHHIIPVSRGGLTIASNLKTLCDDCHSKKPGHKHISNRRR